MARQAERIAGKDHRPRHMALDRPAPQLSVDEVGDAPEHHPERHVDGDVVAHPDERELVAPGDPGDREQGADHAAVEAHPAVPQPQQIPAHGLAGGEVREQARLAGVAAGVEQRIAQPSAENDAERAVEEQVVRMALRHRGPGRLDHPRQVPIAEQDAGKVGQRIEPQGEEAEIDAWPEAEVRPVKRLADGSG